MKAAFKGFITQKLNEKETDCADSYSYNLANDRFAVSDGVSQSFYPKIWSQILVENFVQAKGKNLKEHQQILEECKKIWKQKINDIAKAKEAPWFVKESFNRNKSAAATFVGLILDGSKKKWSYIVIGDSYLFFNPANNQDFEKVIKQPNHQNPQFNNSPDYLDSIGKTKGRPKMGSKELVAGTFYLMTDALAEWVFNKKNNALKELDDCITCKDFKELIRKERFNKKLKDDDTSVVIIKIEDNTEEPISYSEGEFKIIGDFNKKTSLKTEKVTTKFGLDSLNKTTKINLPAQEIDDYRRIEINSFFAYLLESMFSIIAKVRGVIFKKHRKIERNKLDKTKISNKF